MNRKSLVLCRSHKPNVCKPPLQKKVNKKSDNCKSRNKNFKAQFEQFRWTNFRWVLPKKLLIFFPKEIQTQKEEQSFDA